MTQLTFRWKAKGETFSFPVQAPYSEGHVLTKAEAQALNVLRMENIRDNIKKRFDEECALGEDGLPSAEGLARLAQVVEQYDLNYQFIEKHEPKEPKLGSLEREALEVARGRASDGASEEEIALLAKTIDCVEAARSRLAARAKIASSSLEDLLA